MKTRFLLVAAALLSGCASMDESACRSANYEHQCKAWVQVSEADYMRGWVDGYREWNTRVHAGDCSNR